MIAVVYSGSHYAHWRLADGYKTIATFRTPGINPYFHDGKYISHLLNKNINLIHHAEEIKKIHFFAAGASSVARKKIVSDALQLFFKNARITIQLDLMGAALALSKEEKGIICILGSGSNAAYFDGKKIKPNNYGLGYILADEGSGNWLGRNLLKGWMSETLPENLMAKFSKRYNYDHKQILEKVYNLPQPGLFLSSFNDFIVDNREDAYVQLLVKTGFKQYIETYVVPLLAGQPDTPVYVVGSVASNFKDYLNEVSADYNINIANIIKEPINNLLNYYTNKN